MKTFYVTTPIYYINDKPHIGHTYTTVAADIIARYHRLLGLDVCFTTGTDEHATKTVEAAKKEGLPPQKYADKMASQWQKTWQELGLTNDIFIRTTNKDHIEAVQVFFQKVYEKGDIYKSKYQGLYCEGCEAFITEKELNNEGKCPDHRTKPVRISEENYFFRLDNYKEDLLEFYEENPHFVQPESKRNEIINFVRDHAKDFSISRQQKEWGIPLPIDDQHSIYVWFDALINYLSAVGFGKDQENYEKYWPANIHLVGKDIIKFHCAYWPAMLFSAGLKIPNTVFAHGFFTIDGEKISKSLGNTIDPLRLKDKYGFDAIRYFLFSEIPFGSDGNFSEERLKERYNGQLANGLGNVVSRIAKLCERLEKPLIYADYSLTDAPEEYHHALKDLRFHDALAHIWNKISLLDKDISNEKTWELHDDKLYDSLFDKVEMIREIATLLEPFMPETSAKIQKQFEGDKIVSQEGLFPRL